MPPSQTLLYRQQRLPFAKSDLWEKLPEDVQAKCNQHLIRLLVLTTVHEQSERKRANERQDSI